MGDYIIDMIESESIHIPDDNGDHVYSYPRKWKNDDELNKSTNPRNIEMRRKSTTVKLSIQSKSIDMDSK